MAQSVIFVLAISNLQRWVYTKVTKQFYVMTPLILINYISAGLYVYVLYEYIELLEMTNEGFGVEESPTKEL